MKSDLQALGLLQFSTLQAYLENAGWDRVDIDKEDISLFRKSTATDEHEVLLPHSRDFADYLPRVFDVVSTIAQVEGRPTEQVVSDLLLEPSDVLRFRLDNKATRDGSFPLDSVFSFLENAKKAIYASACDLLQPEKYHKRLGLKGATQFIEQCRLGQTERGSFVAPIICPFLDTCAADRPTPLTIYQRDLFAKSFTRAVTTRLMWSVSEIKKSIDKNELNRIVELEGKNTISGNLLEAVHELTTLSSDSKLEIAASWSPFAPRPKLSPLVKMSQDYLPGLETLLSKIKPADQNPESEFVGKISSTKADPDAENRAEGEIVLNYILGDEEKASKAKVTLSKPEYDQACEAHRTGKTVKITGRLANNGRTKAIENARLTVI